MSHHKHHHHHGHSHSHPTRRAFVARAGVASAAGLISASDVSAQSARESGALARRMREAALAFLDSLDSVARAAITQPLAGDQRTQWSNLPTALVPRAGVPVVAMSETSRRRFHALLRASTSSQGYLKIAEIMRHDEVLRVIELDYLSKNPPRPQTSRRAVESMSSGQYWVSIFGDPNADENWGWLVTGHHLGASFTCAGNSVAAAPMFLGGAPVEIMTGLDAGLSALGHEALRGLELARALEPGQAKVAVLSSENAFSDIMTPIGRKNSLQRFEGLPASELDARQRRLLRALVWEYVGNADHDASARHYEAIDKAGWNNLHFMWRGGVGDVDGPFYYRVHGPRLVIEFAMQEANHFHTIMRDPQNDYGVDWLGQHYEEHERAR